MRKIFFATLLSLSILFLCCTGCHNLPANNDIDLEQAQLPDPFDPFPLQLGQSPIDELALSENTPRSYAPEFPRRIVMVGLEGLNWDVLNHLLKHPAIAPNISQLIQRGVRASLQTGLSGYATPEKCWKLLLTGKPLNQSNQQFLWDILRDKRLALIDVPYSVEENATSGIFFSRRSQSIRQLEKSPLAFETKTGFDNASQKFEMIRNKDFELALVNINQPDKVQHRAYLGYVIESIRGTKGLAIDPKFNETFLKNNRDLQLVYQDMDRVAEYLLKHHTNDLVILFSVHGHRLSPYEIRMELTYKWFEKLNIKGGSNISLPTDVTIEINGTQLNGQQQTKAMYINVLQNNDNGKETRLRIVYKRLVFELMPDLHGISAKNSLKKVVLDALSKCTVSGGKIFRAGYRQNALIIEPKPQMLKMISIDDAYRYDGGIEVVRVQSGHTAKADGIFIAAGPSIPSNIKIDPVKLTDLLPYILYYSGAEETAGVVPRPVYQTLKKIDFTP